MKWRRSVRGLCQCGQCCGCFHHQPQWSEVGHWQLAKTAQQQLGGTTRSPDLLRGRSVAPALLCFAQRDAMRWRVWTRLCDMAGEGMVAAPEWLREMCLGASFALGCANGFGCVAPRAALPRFLCVNYTTFVDDVLQRAHHRRGVFLVLRSWSHTQLIGRAFQ